MNANRDAESPSEYSTGYPYPYQRLYETIAANRPLYQTQYPTTLAYPESGNSAGHTNDHPTTPSSIIPFLSTSYTQTSRNLGLTHDNDQAMTQIDNVDLSQTQVMSRNETAYQELSARVRAIGRLISWQNNSTSTSDTPTVRPTSGGYLSIWHTQNLSSSERHGLSSRRPHQRRGFQNAEAGPRMEWLVKRTHATGLLPHFSRFRTSEDVVNTFASTGNTVSFKDVLAEENPAEVKDGDERSRSDTQAERAIDDQTEGEEEGDGDNNEEDDPEYEPSSGAPLTRSTSFSSSTSRRSLRQVHFTNPVSDTLGNVDGNPLFGDLGRSNSQTLVDEEEDNHGSRFTPRAGTPPPDVVFREMNVGPFLMFRAFDHVEGGEEDEIDEES